MDAMQHVRPASIHHHLHHCLPSVQHVGPASIHHHSIIVSLCSACQTSLHTPPLHHCLPSVQHVRPASIHHHSIIVSLCSACQTSLHTPPLHHCLPLFSMSDQPPYATTPSLSPSVQHVRPASIRHHSIIVSLCSACRTSLHTPPLHHCLPLFSMSDQPPYTTTPSLSPSVQHVRPASIHHRSIIVSLCFACRTSLHTPPLHHCLPSVQHVGPASIHHHSIIVSPLFSMSDQPPYTTTPSLSPLCSACRTSLHTPPLHHCLPSVQHVGPASIHTTPSLSPLCSACQTSLHTPPLHHCLPSVQHVGPASIHHHSIIVSLCSACRTSLHTPPLHHCLPLFSMSDEPPYTTTPSLSPSVQHVRPASIRHHPIIVSPLFSMSDQPPYTTTPSLSPSVQHVGPASIHHHSIIVSLCSACRTSLHTPPLHNCLPLFSMSDQPPYTTTPSLSPSVQHVGPASIRHHLHHCLPLFSMSDQPPYPTAQSLSPSVQHVGPASIRHHLHHCLPLFSMSDQPPYPTAQSLSPSVQHVGPASIRHHLHHCLPLFSMSDQPPYPTAQSLSPSVQHVGPASIRHHSIIVSPLFSMSDQPPYTTTPSLSPSVQHVGPASIHHHSIIVSLCSACRTSLHTPPLHHCLHLFNMSDQPPYATTPSLSPLCSACQTSLHTPPLHHCLPLFSMSDQPPYTTTPSLSPSVQHVGPASIHHHSIIVSLCSACQTSLHTPPLHHCLPLFSMSDQPPYATTSIIVSLCSACRTSLHTPPLNHCLPQFSMSDQPPYTTTPSLSPSVQHVGPASIHHHPIIVSLGSACRTSLHTPPLHHCLPRFSMSDQPPYTTTPSLSPSVQHVGPASIRHHSIIVSLCSACRPSLHTPPPPSLSPSVQHVGPASIHHHSIIVSLCSACRTSLHTPPLHHCLPLFSMSDQPPYTTTSIIVSLCSACRTSLHTPPPPSLSPSVQHVGPASIHHHSIIVSLCSACRTSLHTPPLHHCLPLFSMSDQPPYTTTPSLSPSVQHVGPASIRHHSIIVSLCSACWTSLHTPPLHHCLPLFSMSDQPPYTTTPSLSPSVQHVGPASIHHHSIIVSLCSACQTSLHTPPLHHCLPLFSMSDQPPYTTTPSLSPSVQHVGPASIHHHSIIVSLCSACRTGLHTPPLHHCLPLFSMSDRPPYTTTSIIVSLCSACRTGLHTPPLHHCLPLFRMSDQPPYPTAPSLSPSVQHVGPASIRHHSIIVSLCSACRTGLHTPPLHHCLPLFSMSDQPPYTTTSIIVSLC